MAWRGAEQSEISARYPEPVPGDPPGVSSPPTEKCTGLRSSGASSHVIWGTTSARSPGLRPLSFSDLDFFFFT